MQIFFTFQTSTIPSKFTFTFNHSVKFHLDLPPFSQNSPSPSTIPSNFTFTFHHSVKFHLHLPPIRPTISTFHHSVNLPTFKHFNLSPVRQISHRQQQHHLHQNDQLCKHCHWQFNAIVIIITIVIIGNIVIIVIIEDVRRENQSRIRFHKIWLWPWTKIT